MYKLCVLAVVASAMALPKIEHRAENSPSGNDWSKYYEKFQEYLQNDRVNNYLKPPSSPASSAGSEVQADQQYGIDFSQYQNGFNGMNAQNFQQYQQYFSNEGFKKCMEQYSPSNFNFPTSLSEASTSSGYGSGSGSSSGASSSSNHNHYSPEQFQAAFQKCRESVESSSNGYNIPNFQNPFGSSSSASGSNGGAGYTSG